MRVDVVHPGGAELGEGPVWWDGALWWLDILGCRLHRWVEDGPARAWPLPETVTSLAPRADGVFAVTLRDGFGLLHPPAYDAGEVVVERAATLALPAGVRCNDAGTDPVGRLWAAPMNEGATRHALSRYRWSGGQVVEVAADVVLGNGWGWSADGTRVWHVDSARGQVLTADYDLEAGVCGTFTPYATVAAGAPDGLAVDVEGGVWVAVWDAGVVRRYAPGAAESSGFVDITVPMSRPTSVAFGGADLRTLYVTSAAQERAHEEHAGALLRLQPGVTGVAVAPFAG